MKWISVDEQMPEPGTEVIAWGKSGGPFFACNCYWDGAYWHRTNCGYGFTVGFYEVSHWLPWPNNGPDSGDWERQQIARLTNVAAERYKRWAEGGKSICGSGVVADVRSRVTGVTLA